MARKRIGDLLVESGMLTESQLQEALADHHASGERLGDVLIKRGFLTERQLIEVLEFQLGIPHVTLARQVLDAAVVQRIPVEMAKRHMAIPIRMDKQSLVVAMADPLDYYALDDLRRVTGLNITPAIAAKDEIRRFIDRYYHAANGMADGIDGVESKADETEFGDDNSPIARMVQQLLQRAIARRASDVHLDPESSSVNVRFRVDGVMALDQTVAPSIYAQMLARVKILAQCNIAERRLPQDGRFRVRVEGRDVDVRVSVLPTVLGERMVLRILDHAQGVATLSDMGMSPQANASLQRLLHMTSGLLLVTGPTGSGKTSTVYASLRAITTAAVNVITIEDPVEFQLPGVNQVAVNLGTGLTFTVGLRSILRQDPDVIMVGEVRDADTAEIAIRAALTGHLVLSTLHTNDAVATVARLIDMGIEPYLVSSALSGVVAQRLLRKVCSDCAMPRSLDAAQIALCDAYGVSATGRFVRGKGCSACGGTGYRDRIAVHEVVIVDESLRRMITNRASEAEMRADIRQRGISSLMHDALRKAAEGITSMEEVVRIVAPGLPG